MTRHDIIIISTHASYILTSYDMMQYVDGINSNRSDPANLRSMWIMPSSLSTSCLASHYWAYWISHSVCSSRERRFLLSTWSMPGQRLRRWPSNDPAVSPRLRSGPHLLFRCCRWLASFNAHMTHLSTTLGLMGSNETRSGINNAAPPDRISLILLDFDVISYAFPGK